MGAAKIQTQLSNWAHRRYDVALELKGVSTGTLQLWFAKELHQASISALRFSIIMIFDNGREIFATALTCCQIFSWILVETGSLLSHPINRFAHYSQMECILFSKFQDAYWALCIFLVSRNTLRMFWHAQTTELLNTSPIRFSSEYLQDLVHNFWHSCVLLGHHKGLTCHLYLPGQGVINIVGKDYVLYMSKQLRSL